MPVGFDEIQIDETPRGKVIELIFKEKLKKKDYKAFVPMVESQMQTSEPVRMLVKLEKFRGWTLGALWEDTKFATKHFKDIERLAVVGDAHWQKGLTLFTKPFMDTQVRYFRLEEIEAARRWIRAA